MVNETRLHARAAYLLRNCPMMHAGNENTEHNTHTEAKNTFTLSPPLKRGACLYQHTDILLETRNVPTHRSTVAPTLGGPVWQC